MDLMCTDIMSPVAQGAWLAVPIAPQIELSCSNLHVLQNNLVDELPSNSNAWVVRNLTVGIPVANAEAKRFLDDVASIENFVRVGTSTMWPVWFGGETFQRRFVSTLRQMSHPRYASEMKLNILLNSRGGSGGDASSSSELQVQDEAGGRVAPQDVGLGAVVRVDLTVTGMWCSTERCGLRYTVRRVVVAAEPAVACAPECLLTED